MNSLFPNLENEWQKEWKDMPEFISENKKPSQQITISFRNYQDVKKFAELLNVKVSNKTDSFWFPIKERDQGEVYSNIKWGKNEK
tara:strand:+ start:442 stop:696 length:255 start_codon:yes stop_codon:yes gene_type:complete